MVCWRRITNRRRLFEEENLVVFVIVVSFMRTSLKKRIYRVSDKS
jgi:hypothetical protein